MTGYLLLISVFWLSPSFDSFLQGGAPIYWALPLYRSGVLPLSIDVNEACNFLEEVCADWLWSVCWPVFLDCDPSTSLSVVILGI